MNALPPEIAQHLGGVRALCERYRVKRLTIFGSAVRGTFDPAKSDVDFVVEFEWDPDPLERGRLWWGLWGELLDLFDRHVDLVQRRSIENPYFMQVLALTERSIYESAPAA
ncbi:MAG: nucleotidyltransferase domain-containing protein [Acidobacteria bacterium]|nr:nucleotidyltransferase domain-containing protein [Acidobacteriota bacterium]MBV9476070.1 nucleotidyltransferase domain-containing protein [Acidobacteriota bacterium]